jgi:hypothetical protein
MNRVAMLCAALALVGCADPNQSARGELRRQYFVECMKLLPAGPTGTKYNDWAEVVSECDLAASRQSWNVVP